MKGYALFSKCEKYRYSLARVWDESKPIILYIMLNPSTATAEFLDPTVKRCLKRAMRLGYGQMLVANLFAYRSTNPSALKKVADPVGKHNDLHICAMALQARTIVLGWGNDGTINGRGAEVVKLLRATLKLHKRKDTLYCLCVNEKTKQPGHPLYLADALEFVEYKT